MSVEKKDRKGKKDSIAPLKKKGQRKGSARAAQGKGKARQERVSFPSPSDAHLRGINILAPVLSVCFGRLVFPRRFPEPLYSDASFMVARTQTTWNVALLTSCYYCRPNRAIVNHSPRGSDRRRLGASCLSGVELLHFSTEPRLASPRLASKSEIYQRPDRGAIALHKSICFK